MTDADWLNTTGTPSNFYQDNISLKEIGLYPAPNADGAEVQFTDSYGIVTYIEINGVLQDFDADFTSNYGVLVYASYNNGEAYFMPGGLGDPTHSNPFGALFESAWSRSNLFLISKTVSDEIDTEDDKLTINEGLDFVVRDYTAFQAYFREGDGQDLLKAIHFKERFENIKTILKSYHQEV